MSSQPLTTARQRIEELAVPAGEYIVVCEQTGTRPVPVADKRFPDRESAGTAARLATEYRAALRRYDGRAPRYDFVVCEAAAGGRRRPDTARSPVSLREGETV
jgi:hypothetical protein